MRRLVTMAATATIFGALYLTQANADDALAVTLATAEKVSNPRKVAFTGELVARDSLKASFPMGGRIAEVFVDDGDKVTEGAVLARIDRVQQEQALRAAQAGLSTATADLVKAREDMRRQDALFESGTTTRSARDSAADQLASASAAEAQARAELDRARKALNDTVLIAPANAVVTMRLVEPGQVVGAAQPVLELALDEKYDAVFDVPEVLLTRPLSDRPVVIELSPINYPERSVSGTISEVAPIVDPAKGTVEVKISLDEPPPGLSYGDAVRGSTELVEPARITIPWSAISATAKGPAVWVVDPSTMAANLRQIDILRYETGWIILDGGVEPGEEIVVKGAQLLYPGRIVRPAEATR
jgi:RND family efflux transporter MFP subunit